MKVLIDESLPRGLGRHLPGHEVTTVPERGWAALGDGELLARASGEFDVFITAQAPDCRLSLRLEPPKRRAVVAAQRVTVHG